MSTVPRLRALLPTALAAALVSGVLLAIAPANPATASTTDAAFNSSTGVLNVAYGPYLSKHDVVYNTPNTNPLYGLTVGLVIMWTTQKGNDGADR